MLDTDDKLILILILLNVLSFFIGFIIGNYKNISLNKEKEVESFFTEQKKKQKNQVVIDETKVVSKINTDNLEKKYDKLGDTKQSQENIANSINKLKNMKG